jgi:hypothetical protein
MFPGNSSVVPLDHIQKVVNIRMLDRNSSTAQAITALSCIGLILCVAFAGLVVHNKALLGSSKHLCLVMILGIALALVSTFAPIDSKAEVRCLTEVWLLFVAYSLVMGSLMVRNDHIYRLFYTRQHMSSLQDSKVYLKLGVLLLLQLIPLLILTIEGYPTSTLTHIRDTDYAYICSYPSKTLFTGVYGFLLVLNGAMLLYATFISVSIKSLPASFQESMFVSLCIYNLALILCIALPLLSFFQLDGTSQYIVQSASVIYSSYLTLFIRFFPLIRSAFFKNSLKENHTKNIGSTNPDLRGSGTNLQEDIFYFDAIIPKKIGPLNCDLACKLFIIVSNGGSAVLSIGDIGPIGEKVLLIDSQKVAVSSLSNAHMFQLSKCKVAVEDSDNSITVSTVQKKSKYPGHSLCFKLATQETFQEVKQLLCRQYQPSTNRGHLMEFSHRHDLKSMSDMGRSGSHFSISGSTDHF